jgi:hypothetical protein
MGNQIGLDIDDRTLKLFVSEPNHASDLLKKTCSELQIPFVADDCILPNYNLYTLTKEHIISLLEKKEISDLLEKD